MKAREPRFYVGDSVDDQQLYDQLLAAEPDKAPAYQLLRKAGVSEAEAKAALQFYPEEK